MDEMRWHGRSISAPAGVLFAGGFCGKRRALDKLPERGALLISQIVGMGKMGQKRHERAIAKLVHNGLHAPADQGIAADGGGEDVDEEGAIAMNELLCLEPFELLLNGSVLGGGSAGVKHIGKLPDACRAAFPEHADHGQFARTDVFEVFRHVAPESFPPTSVLLTYK